MYARDWVGKFVRSQTQTFTGLSCCVRELANFKQVASPQSDEYSVAYPKKGLPAAREFTITPVYGQPVCTLQ